MGDDGDAVRVLLVDDDPGYADLAAEGLERAVEGFVVETAADAEAGLERLEDGAFDGVVSDYDLPGSDGVSFLEQVRSRWPDLPFVLLTAKGSEEVASEAIAAGVTDYLRKEAGADQFALLANRLRNAVEAHRARRASEASERRLRRVHERITDGFFGVDSDWTYVYVNEEGADLVGRSPEELLGQTVWEAFPGLVDTPFEDALRRAMATQETTSVDSYYPPLDAWYDVRVYPSPEGISIYFQDVSEERARAEELRRLKEEYEMVFETAQDAIFLVDVDRSGEELAFRFNRLNPAHEAISGLSSSAVRGKTPAEVLDEDDAAQVVANYRRCVETREPIAYDEVLSMPRGDIHWRTKLGPVVTDGEVTQIVGVARDVTEQHERQRALERQNERLEEFASVVSHDLRNPLNVAAGHLELAREEDDEEHLEVVATALGRMEGLIDDLLALAREGREVGDLERVDLADVAEGCWSTVETGSASLEVEADGSVLADPTRLRQLLENLFRNAVEYGGEDVSVVVDDRDGGFCVADDGPGIPDAVRERVFSPRYSTAEDGTGLGLSIVREIAEAHGWTVDVGESEAGGARFEFAGVERG